MSNSVDIPFFELLFGGGLIVYNAVASDKWPPVSRGLMLIAGVIILVDAAEKYRQ